MAEAGNDSRIDASSASTHCNVSDESRFASIATGAGGEVAPEPDDAGPDERNRASRYALGTTSGWSSPNTRGRPSTSRQAADNGRTYSHFDGSIGTRVPGGMPGLHSASCTWPIRCCQRAAVVAISVCAHNASAASTRLRPRRRRPARRVPGPPSPQATRGSGATSPCGRRSGRASPQGGIAQLRRRDEPSTFGSATSPSVPSGDSAPLARTGAEWAGLAQSSPLREALFPGGPPDVRVSHVSGSLGFAINIGALRVIHDVQ